MESIHYLEVSSSNRNRNQFPYISDFDIILSSPNPLNIIDPIITGPRWFTWQGGAGSTLPDTPSEIPAISSGIITGNYRFELKLNQTEANPLQEMPYGYGPYNDPNVILSSDPLYYNGYRLVIKQLDSKTYARIISSYDPKLGTVSVNPGFFFNTDIIIPDGTLYYIVDPTQLNFPPPPNSSLNQVHLPITDAFGYNAIPYSQSYNHFFLVDETISSNDQIIYQEIINYDSLLRIATLKASIPNWSYSDIYSITQYPPPNKFIIENVDTYNQKITLPSYLNYGTGYFTGQYMYSTGLIGTGASSSGFSFQTINSTGPVDSAFYILDYSGAPANILTLSPNSTNPNNNILPQINNYGIPGLNDIVTIGTLVRDNFYPLQYSGTIVSQNESVAYEVSLSQLCLPNVLLDTGSRIAQYPYVYVQLSPIGSPSTVGKNIIYSNNPNVNRALFTVAVTYVVDPLTSVFVRLSTNQVQTIKIKPNDSFHFSVYLSDGSLFLPADKNDIFYSPFPPNPFLQIEAVFGFRRL